MLRIDTSTTTDGTTLTLEGRVVGPWADELAGYWRSLVASRPGPFRVDLDGVTFADAAGTAVLRAMRLDGAVLVATTVMMRALVDEIAAGPNRRDA
jgi:ABC-type transporter Mla MlaB component